MELHEYVATYSERGSCRCGKCLDAPEVPEQPHSPTVNLTFFEVALKDNPDLEEFKALVTSYMPEEDQERNYLELGAAVGDQGLALQMMGMGHLLGVWKVLSPDTLMPILDDDTKMRMAGAGMVSITTL